MPDVRITLLARDSSENAWEGGGGGRWTGGGGISHTHNRGIETPEVEGVQPHSLWYCSQKEGLTTHTMNSATYLWTAASSSTHYPVCRQSMHSYTPEFSHTLIHPYTDTHTILSHCCPHQRYPRRKLSSIQYTNLVYCGVLT